MNKRYALAAPARPLQMELQDQIVSLHYSFILKFFNSTDSTEIAKESLITMVRNSLTICSHPYLLINQYFPKSLTTRDIPKRLCDTSGKFQILSDILTQMISTGNALNVCVIGRPSKMLDLIDALCMGHHCNIIKHDGIKLRDSYSSKRQKNEKRVNVHIIGSDFVSNSKNNSGSEEDQKGDSSKGNSIRFDFVLNMDIMADLDNDWLRFNTTDSSIYINILTSNSVEHIIYHFLKGQKVSLEAMDPCLNNIVAALVVLREKIGHISSGLKPAYVDNLAYLRPYIANHTGIPWALPDMPNIGQYTSDDVEKSLLREVRFGFDHEDIGSDGNIKHHTQSKKVDPFFDGGYYLGKRLEKKYLSNPLLNGYTQLTGISRQVRGDEVPTHTLMYDYNDVLIKWNDMNGDLKMFDDFNDSRIKNWNSVKDELDSKTLLAKEKEERLAHLEKSIVENDTQGESIKQEIADYEAKLKKFEDDPNLSQYSKQDQLKHDLLLEISKLEAKLESSTNETKYMNEEIERAQKSIVESQSKMSEYTTKVNELNSKIAELIATSNTADMDDSNLKMLKKNTETENAQQIATIANLLLEINSPNVRQRAAPKRVFKR